ncbi:glycosyltransferase family 2 protein [Alkalihalobacillus sp. AL-G]|uniref:glycosyltransferase n=1 Tax=Alkalihalobacillus sp. AL-G TaxID=2926399 RepID=UPI00272A31AB|nr:glycosyltransferase family A protein [Alkalihalobacillus sp. AL-G]WLD94946.1 glycosyltransferase family 2 protein [Alkalihalobacillus sp. AL-G]
MISVITCTNKQDCLSTILQNYMRQTWQHKELILILNNDDLDFDEWKQSLSHIPNISIYQLSQEKTLGECLNYGVSKSKYNYIAKFDDDDYYSKHYLKDSIRTLRESQAKVVGKTTIYMYFEEDQSLQLYNPYKYAPDSEKISENQYDRKVMMGGTLFFEKKIQRVVPFQSTSIGEDAKFCEDCLNNDIPIYSGSKDNYVYIRKSNDAHTWKIQNQKLRRFCTHLIKTDHFQAYLFDE